LKNARYFPTTAFYWYKFGYYGEANMFKDLMSFEMVRTPVQALGFYIAYLLIGILIGALLGGVGATVMGATGSNAAAVGLQWGAISAIAYSFVIGAVIVVKKKLGLGYYALFLLGAVLAIFGGGILGLLPAAFLTTRQAQQVE
jgi:hypothetical protein